MGWLPASALYSRKVRLISLLLGATASVPVSFCAAKESCASLPLRGEVFSVLVRFSRVREGLTGASLSMVLAAGSSFQWQVGPGATLVRVARVGTVFIPASTQVVPLGWVCVEAVAAKLAGRLAPVMAVASAAKAAMEARRRSAVRWVGFVARSRWGVCTWFLGAVMLMRFSSVRVGLFE